MTNTSTLIIPTQSYSRNAIKDITLLIRHRSNVITTIKYMSGKQANRHFLLAPFSGK